MNVLLIANYFDRDGLASKALTEAKYLTPLGVHLIVVVPKNPFARAGVTARLQALGMKYYSALTHFRIINFFLPFSILKLSRIIRREKIDLLHVNHGKTLVLGAVLGWLHQLPLVYTIHGVSRRELPLTLKDLLFRRVSRVIAVSEESAAFFKSQVRYPASRIVVSRNAIDFSHFAAVERIRGGSFNVLYMSRLDRDKRKAVEAVMDAVARLFPERPQLRLRILGDGRQYNKIKKKACALNRFIGRDVIAIDGWADDPAEYMVKADVVIGVGRCVLEAIALGMPTLVAGNEGIGGLVTDANFHSLQKTNFSGRGAAVSTSGENLARELGLISGKTAGGAKLRTLARSDHDAAVLALAIKAVFQQAVPHSARN
jgi:glycosyltransferase involved in cell wall biosynthesis